MWLKYSRLSCALFLYSLLAWLIFLVYGNCLYQRDSFVQKFRVILFLKEGLTKVQINNLAEQLRVIPGVNDVQYFSKEDALATVRQHKFILDSVTLIAENPFPSSLSVSFKLPHENHTKIDKFVSFINAGSFSGIENVMYNPRQLETIIYLNKIVVYLQWCAGLAIFFAGIGLLLNLIFRTSYTGWGEQLILYLIISLSTRGMIELIAQIGLFTGLQFPGFVPTFWFNLALIVSYFTFTY